MLLAQISDTHLLSLKGNDRSGVKRADNLVRCVNTINEMPSQPAAVVHTGDMVNFGPQGAIDENGYELAHEILSQLKAPLFPAVGNRDSRAELMERFVVPDLLFANAPFCQYRVTLEQADLLCVDTKSATRRVGASCPDRLSQIEQLLQQDTKKPVFVFLHHPPTRIEALNNPLQFESAGQAAALTDLFDQYDNIVRILCGHTHRSDMLKMGKHCASTHPSLATDVRLDHYPASLVHEPVFQMHELHADNSVTSMSHFATRSLRAAA